MIYTIGDAWPLGACLGIDLAGLPHRETGVALLHHGRLELLSRAAGDDEILAFVAMAGPHPTLAINAPLTRPTGRCCLDDDCPCRHDPGTRSRQLERDLLHLRIPILATALIKVLARRGFALSATLRQLGHQPLEVYLYATLRLLDLPAQGKRTALGRRRIHAALQPLIPGLDHPDASEHGLDAVVCALTAQLWQQGRTVAVGDPLEGQMIIPDPSTSPSIAIRATQPVPAALPLRRVAESPQPYATESEAWQHPGPNCSASDSQGSAP